MKNKGARINVFFQFILLMLIMACNSSAKQSDYVKGTYGYDVEFFKQEHINMLQLKDDASGAAVLISPDFQARVMTSSAKGMDGSSFGWINHDYIKAGDFNTKFNPFGGEERFWLGPEGGPFSIYFDQDAEQSFENWRVPKVLDTLPFEVVEKSDEKISFQKNFELDNAKGTSLKVGVERSIKLLSQNQVENALNCPLSNALNWVAYETENTLFNKGENNWTEENGFLSIWLLCMFNPSEKGVVFIPYKEGSINEMGKVVEDNYFAKVPSERLIAKDGMIYFKVDGKHRGKIGVSPKRSTPFCGSYDPEKGSLTILWYSKPEGNPKYVNSKWGEQTDPLVGEVLNSYNDGPVEDGSIMGPFYEIESSSPAALLSAGDSLKHTQRIFHIIGAPESLNEITQSIFNISIEDIESAFSEKNVLHEY